MKSSIRRELDFIRDRAPVNRATAVEAVITAYDDRHIPDAIRQLRALGADGESIWQQRCTEAASWLDHAWEAMPEMIPHWQGPSHE